MNSIETFFKAWGDLDPERRAEAISSAIAGDGTYADPMTPEPLTGPDPVAEYVGAFTSNAPGATAAVVDQQDRHGTSRVTVEFRMADGQVQHGQYFVEFADDDKIARMVGFVGLGAPAESS